MYISDRPRFPNFNSLPNKTQRRFIHDEESLSIFAITSFIEFVKKYKKLSLREGMIVQDAIDKNDVKTLMEIFNSVE